MSRLRLLTVVALAFSMLAAIAAPAGLMVELPLGLPAERSGPLTSSTRAR